MSIVTRFAPSPTGYLHIGGVRTALYAYLLAKASDEGKFLIRIEDTDRTRFVEGAEEDILKSLAWVGIESDGEIIRQSERSAIYTEHVDRLIAEGHAYPCFCTSERLEQMRADQLAAKRPPMYDRTCERLSQEEVAERIAAGEPHVIRLKINKEKIYEVNDLVRGLVEFKGETVDDQVILKSDGMPTYHLASVVDDHLQGVNTVIRGEEWLPSTPKHIALHDAFGWEVPSYAHIPLLLGKDGSKLSKRTGDVAFADFIAKGYLKEALINFISLLGWNPGDEREMFSMEDLIATFDVNRIHKAGAVFDYEKLDWMNGKYIRSLDLVDLTARVKPLLVADGLIGDDYNDELLSQYVGELQDRFVTLTEAPELMHFFFKDATELEYDSELLGFKKQTVDEAVKALEIASKELTLIEHWNRDHLNDELRRVAGENDMKPGEILWPIRVALTGEDKSPGTFELLEVFGKEESLKRIEVAIKKASAK